MRKIRLATVHDSAIIAAQRCQMFQDNSLSCSASLAELEQRSSQWLQRHLADGSYAGWLVVEDETIIAGAGVWFMEWPPHYLHLDPMRGYLLNFCIHPPARGQGIPRNSCTSPRRMPQTWRARRHASRIPNGPPCL